MSRVAAQLPDTKACGRCGAIKPIGDYYVNHGNGRHSACKTCKNDDRVKSREKHRNRYLARAKVNNALAAGLLVKQPCENCGNPFVHGHHDDYSKPLTVRWLCKQHHDEWHKNNEVIE